MKSVLSLAARSAALLAFSSSMAFAQSGESAGYLGIGAGLAIGLAALGGGLGQGRTASAALEGMARNPQAAGQLQTPMILGLVFTETLSLFGLIIALKLAGLI